MGLGERGGQEFTTACLLMVQNVGNIKPLEILHLQDSVKVLQPLVIIGHVWGQVAIDDADIVAIKFHADVNTPFIPLKRR